LAQSSRGRLFTVEDGGRAPRGAGCRVFQRDHRVWMRRRWSGGRGVLEIRGEASSADHVLGARGYRPEFFAHVANRSAPAGWRFGSTAADAGPSFVGELLISNSWTVKTRRCLGRGEKPMIEYAVAISSSACAMMTSASLLTIDDPCGRLRSAAALPCLHPVVGIVGRQRFACAARDQRVSRSRATYRTGTGRDARLFLRGL